MTVSHEQLVIGADSVVDNGAIGIGTTNRGASIVHSSRKGPRTRGKSRPGVYILAFWDSYSTSKNT